MPVVTTTFGRLEGVQREGHVAFLGVPYAAPPVGPLRWRAPLPPVAWAGTR
ncbi:carboxylesterase family protein, partial [Tepidiforma sp.]|uniref:carboxylesterase family protein n=1 Tax=Tepidiforma sp. TaxID=2682230 RepID=UPI003A0FDC8E